MLKRAIISGATGAIGTALIKELIENNIEVLVFCHCESKRENNIPVHPLVSKKYCSLSELCEIKNDTGKQYDIFYHFAWAGTFGQSRNDMFLQNKNVQYALDAVSAAKKFGCHTFIGAGSQAEYGRFEGVLKPDTPAFPENGYGIAKLCAGQMTREYAHQIGLRHIWVRVLSIYGPNDGENSMVMSTINKLISGITPEFTKCEQIWDYLFSYDAAKAFRLLGERGVDGKIYVLGSGNPRPLIDFINEIKNTFAPDAEINIGRIPYAQKQVMHLCADISELKEDTGFMPSFTFLEGLDIMKSEREQKL